jgi:hypothetical protein
MTALQKGKVLKVLNKKINYFSNGKYVNTISRKDFIKNHLENGSNIQHKKNVRTWTKKGITEKENSFQLVLSDESYYEITKTEFDYANYLLEKVITA